MNLLSFLKKLFFGGGRITDPHRRPFPARPDLSYLDDADGRMAKLWSRVTLLMEEKRPWLDSEFSIGHLAQRLFCNRSFLSKTINLCSGHNFRWLVNSYRVSYAADLMKRDPRMKIEQVADLSGFNTLPTFNAAFKIQMRQRPSEYLGQIRRGH